MVEKLGRIRGILLDFDGIIADSEKYFYTAAYDAFKELGHYIDEEEYYKYWGGEGLGVEHEVQRHNIQLGKVEVQTLREKTRSNYHGLAASGAVRLYPEAREFLEGLKRLARKNDLDLVIASNTTGDLIEEIFRKNGYDDFDIPLMGHIPGLRKKPESDIFSYACGYLRIRPHEALVIEDMPKGIKAAKKIEILVFALRNRYNRSLDLSRADEIFESHKEMIYYLEMNLRSNSRLT